MAGRGRAVIRRPPVRVVRLVVRPSVGACTCASIQSSTACSDEPATPRAAATSGSPVSRRIAIVCAGESMKTPRLSPTLDLQLDVVNLPCVFDYSLQNHGSCFAGERLSTTVRVCPESIDVRYAPIRAAPVDAFDADLAGVLEVVGHLPAPVDLDTVARRLVWLTLPRHVGAVDDAGFAIARCPTKVPCPNQRVSP